ncbi:PadR family transcriptional regulator [Aldersonia sp. NBC_00410]|uniref:PadR family transcriptional regulator n=1 Tax=Aldersonia sp. NBC_00410 TaxID=2975954 RepID=UPI00224DE90D|nr:PadR family transcriptional regulator [Aldersonia sp. NBC_00410]MCX5042832.1 PadR family transcriptional regulator [Aldersonia sp. NBC_00410]
MPEKRTTTAYALLGLLSVRSWTTYELAKQVQRSLNWFWPRAERKLYDEPKRLVAGGLATAVQEQQGKRPRTVYQITPEGRAALGDWLGEPPAPRTLEFEGMVKIFFADGGSLDQLVGTLDAIEEEAIERMSALAEMAAAPPVFPERAHISALTMKLHFAQEDAVLQWARWAKEQVTQWESARDAGEWDWAGELARLVAAVRTSAHTRSSGAVCG